MWASFGAVVLVYASVWFVWRPICFHVAADTLRIEWPIRVRDIPRSAVRSARTLTAKEFRREYGYGMRIGAGGLWGGFGLLKTQRGTFSMWISRFDRLVIVELDGARPLLISPEDPEEFAEQLAQRG